MSPEDEMIEGERIQGCPQCPFLNQGPGNPLTRYPYAQIQARPDALLAIHNFPGKRPSGIDCRVRDVLFAGRFKYLETSSCIRILRGYAIAFAMQPFNFRQVIFSLSPGRHAIFPPRPIIPGPKQDCIHLQPIQEFRRPPPPTRRPERQPLLSLI